MSEEGGTMSYTYYADSKYIGIKHQNTSNLTRKSMLLTQLTHCNNCKTV